MPNDPRGSWSESIRVYELTAFGPATKVTTTRSVAHADHDHARRLAAKRALRYPPVRFRGSQARAIGRGFADAAEEGGYRLDALAVLPDHTHVLVARHSRDIDEIARHFKAKATQRMSAIREHPMLGREGRDGRLPSPWARNHWKVFIDTDEHYAAAKRYVEHNPLKAGWPRQRWAFVGSGH